MESKMNEFIKITEGEKVALIDRNQKLLNPRLHIKHTASQEVPITIGGKHI